MKDPGERQATESQTEDLERDFPGGPVVKTSPSTAGGAGRSGVRILSVLRSREAGPCLSHGAGFSPRVQFQPLGLFKLHFASLMVQFLRTFNVTKLSVSSPISVPKAHILSFTYMI